MNLIGHKGITLGSDPELFFKKNGKIVPSMDVIQPVEKYFDGYSFNDYAKITRDGVQVEFNPMHAGCRQSHWHLIERCFSTLISKCKEKKCKATFEQVVHFTDEEIKALPEEAKRFGCAPSFNVYTPGEDKTSLIPVDAQIYPYRSAGGHIHIGGITGIDKELLVKILDRIVGNTFVLLDRHPLMEERRKVYGRAGEYRLPKHGLEYRTLSNFWLRDYKLMSLAFGLTRQAVVIAKNKDFANEVLLKVSDMDIQKAINKNDYDLAMQNFKTIMSFIVSNAFLEDDMHKKYDMGEDWYGYPSVYTGYDDLVITSYNNRFEKFCKFLLNPPEFPDDILKASKSYNSTCTGFESWLEENY